MDHIPRIPQNMRKVIESGETEYKFLCSEITKNIAKIRTQGKFDIPENAWMLNKEAWAQEITYLQKRTIGGNRNAKSLLFKDLKISLIENGHTYGSTSLLIEWKKKRILYTGDFITEDRTFQNKTHRTQTIYGLKPINCDYLITECTFGAPKYIFPSFEQIQMNTRNYIRNSLERKTPVILLGYSFGKAQHLLQILSGFKKVLLHRNIAKLVEALERHGIKFPDWEPYGNYNKNKLRRTKDYILLIPPYSVLKEPYTSLISAGVAVMLFSGKIYDTPFCKKFSADKYIPFSDHCDFNNLRKFVVEANPVSIWLEHGKIQEFTYLIKKIESVFSLKI